MTTPLRAFLLVRAPPGEWDVSVHHDLEGLVRAWGAASAAAPGASAIVHVGFERAPTSVFEEVASAHPGRVLLTQGGRYALPGTFLSSPHEVGEGIAGPLYLGLRGWGYELAEAQLPRRQRAPQPFADWLVNYAAEHPDEAESLQMAGVVDEATYLSGEGGLPWALRRKMGTFRFRALIEGQNADPCAVALCAPPWMLSRGVASTDVSVRVFNVFSACGISTVEDLSRASVSELLRLPNFGRKSVTDILRWLDHTLNAGPPTDEIENVAAAGPDLLFAIRRTLMSYGARERDILARRMGLDGLPETLAEIGLSFGITRERVRQIEARALEKLILEETWDDVLRDKLSLILKDRSFPLPLLGVEVVDSWFSGVSENTCVFRYVAANICRGEVGLITVDGIEYVGFIDQARWDLAVSEARKLLEGGAGRGWTRSRCESLVAAMLPAYAGEFSTLLWDRATRFCHFSADGQGEDILQTYGRGAEQVVQAILQESPSPLHYSEIADLAGRRGRGILDPRRAHNAAASVGFLLGRGTYGLAKHLSLGVEDMATVADEAAEMIASGDAGRQWHSSEILSLLAEQGSVPAQRANRYEIDVALRLADDLDSHGRMIWSRRAASGTDAARIDLRQAVLAILEKAGRPLKTADIRQRLVALRGVGQNFQIVAQDPLLRVGPGRWGLNDRDFVVKRSDQKALVDKLLDALTRDGKGIHASELWSFVPRVDLLTTEEVFSIAVLDPRLHVGPGQYLFLSEWGSSRRVTVSESVSLVLNEAVGALTVGEIIARVQVHLGRSCDRPSVSACLQALDAELLEDGRWRLGQTEPETDSVEFPSRE